MKKPHLLHPQVPRPRLPCGPPGCFADGHACVGWSWDWACRQQQGGCLSSLQAACLIYPWAFYPCASLQAACRIYTWAFDLREKVRRSWGAVFGLLACVRKGAGSSSHPLTKIPTEKNFQPQRNPLKRTKPSATLRSAYQYFT